MAKKKAAKQPGGRRKPEPSSEPEMRPSSDPPEGHDYPFVARPDGKWHTIRPPEGAEIVINFGKFLVVATSKGCVPVMTSAMRKEVALAHVEDGGKDRLLCPWPDVEEQANKEEVYAELLTASLKWIEKGRVP